jgi:hypothetical protein
LQVKENEFRQLFHFDGHYNFRHFLIVKDNSNHDFLKAKYGVLGLLEPKKQKQQRFHLGQAMNYSMSQQVKDRREIHNSQLLNL